MYIHTHVRINNSLQLETIVHRGGKQYELSDFAQFIAQLSLTDPPGTLGTGLGGLSDTKRNSAGKKQHSLCVAIDR